MKIQKMSFSAGAFTVAISMVLLFGAAPQRAVAQAVPQASAALPDATGAATRDTTPDTARDKKTAPAASDTTAAILDELEKMRARIAELEAQLKQQMGTNAAASALA